MKKMLKYVTNKQTNNNNNDNKETFRSVVIALFLALIIRSILFEPFSVPSGSMEPNFTDGDYFFVSKFQYGISKYSFPFGPNIFSGRKFIYKKPERGDVVVFRTPSDPNVYYIKRLIGLPGDKIQILNGKIILNGNRLEQKLISQFTNKHGEETTLYEEIQDSGVRYEILDSSPFGTLDNTQEFNIPEKHYFFMGDNRDHSIDSRLLNGPVGYVHEEFLIGKAEMILFSNKEPVWKIWKWLFSFDTSRFFKFVNP